MGWNLLGMLNSREVSIIRHEIVVAFQIHCIATTRVAAVTTFDVTWNSDTGRYVGDVLSHLAVEEQVDLLVGQRNANDSRQNMRHQISISSQWTNLIRKVLG